MAQAGNPIRPQPTRPGAPSRRRGPLASRAVPTEDTRERLLAAAEVRARKGGWHGFSFRDLAEDVGIRSASVHYHFPSKGDLVVALVERYRARSQAALGRVDSLPVREALRLWSLRSRGSINAEDGRCLCGLLAAERALLPDAARAAVDRFFADQQAWLAALLQRMPMPPLIAAQRAAVLLATLQGVLVTHGSSLPTAIDAVLRTAIAQATAPA